MHTDIKNYVASCEKCTMGKRSKFERPAPLQVFDTPKYPFYRLSTDIIGPLQRTDKGHLYCLLFTDHYSKFLIGFAIKNQSADTVAKCLAKVVTTYGAPEYLLSDKGKNYTSGVIFKADDTCCVPNFTSPKVR